MNKNRIKNIDPVSRRQFLRLLGGGLAAVSLGTACGTNSNLQQNSPSPRAVDNVTQSGAKTLKIAQWGHFVPAYTAWFNQFIQKWGADNDVEVVVDYIGLGNTYVIAGAEAAAQQGHDLLWFPSSPASFEPELLDLSDVVSEIENNAGPMNRIVKKSTFNPKTGKQFGVSDYWTPGPVIWRKDLWEQAEPGAAPDTWDDLLRVGKRLKAMGHPLGIGMSAELDSNMALRSLMYTFGATVQNEEAAVTINSPQTIEAIKMGSALFTETMTPEVLGWASSSNNQFIASGTGSLIVNAISVLRSVEKNNLELAKNLWLSKAIAGPEQRLLPANVVGVYTIWKFAKNISLAKKFIVDLVLQYGTVFPQSELFNLPAFPGTVSNFKQLVSNDSAASPADKYAILQDAEQWSTNFGYPGSDNAAVNQVMSSYIIPKMFALAAQKELTAAEAAKWAENKINDIFAQWKSRDLI